MTSLEQKIEEIGIRFIQEEILDKKLTESDKYEIVKWYNAKIKALASFAVAEYKKELMEKIRDLRIYRTFTIKGTETRTEEEVVLKNKLESLITNQDE